MQIKRIEWELAAASIAVVGVYVQLGTKNLHFLVSARNKVELKFKLKINKILLKRIILRGYSAGFLRSRRHGESPACIGQQLLLRVAAAGLFYVAAAPNSKRFAKVFSFI